MHTNLERGGSGPRAPPPVEEGLLVGQLSQDVSPEDIEGEPCTSNGERDRRAVTGAISEREGLNCLSPVPGNS